MEHASFSRVAVSSAVISGVAAVPVTIEVVVERGLPMLTIIGMQGDAEMIETCEKVRCAIKSSGFTFPEARIIVNITPKCISKRGGKFDLAIAAAILAATGQIDFKTIDGALLVGELMLDGTVRGGVRGFVPMAAYALDHSMLIYASSDQVVSAASRESVGTWRAVDALADLSRLDDINDVPVAITDDASSPVLTFDDIAGYEITKSHLSYAVENHSNVLIFTRSNEDIRKLVSCMPAMMGDMDETLTRKCEAIASATQMPFSGTRPLRAPHHSATRVGMLGGGNPIHPGEITLAHGGILFLEDVQEFVPSVLNSIRPVIRERSITITRADGTIEMPADFVLVATAQPCPCGHYGDSRRECTCSANTIIKYRERCEGAGGGIFDLVVSA